jgi:hypothetical protein
MPTHAAMRDDPAKMPALRRAFSCEQHQARPRAGDWMPALLTFAENARNRMKLRAVARSSFFFSAPQQRKISVFTLRNLR